VFSFGVWSAVRPPSRASPLPQFRLRTAPCGEAAPLNTMSVSSSTAFDLRARRQAEWRDLSGGGSAATVWRSQTQREEVQRSKP
jgi:hypothetical protein